MNDMGTAVAPPCPSGSTNCGPAEPAEVAESPSTRSLMDLFGGRNVFVRTVTYHYTGRLVAVTPDGALILEDAAWIADSGRFAKALSDGDLSEVEPYPAGHVVVSAIVDVSEWHHDLPRETR